MSDNVQRPYSVSELTREIKMMLEGAYPEIFLEGEVSNFKAASSGHWYFTLKDSNSMIQAVMFRGSQRSVPSLPSDGQMVRVRGNISVYAQRGNYQLICSSMEFGGEGQILQMLEQRKRRLAAEGLFAEDLKKPLPLFPKTVAVLSAETGAAVRDIIHVINRRAPWLMVRVVNIPVQGKGAAERMIEALKLCEELKLGEVIILGRGGGSLEDLLEFSDENLVRYISEMKTPVISAVGHEIDWALSDFVADLRAPTPSAAAEMLCANAEELYQRVMANGKTIAHSFLSLRSRLRLALKPFSSEALEQSFRKLLEPRMVALDDSRERLSQAMDLLLQRRRAEYSAARRELQAVDPFAILKRGYAIVRDDEQTITGTAGEAKKSARLSIQFQDGTLPVSVLKDIQQGEKHT